MKVSIGQFKPEEDQKSPKPSKGTSGSTISWEFLVCTAMLAFGLLLLLKMWDIHVLQDKVFGLDSRIKAVEADFQILTNEIGKTERRISDVVHDVSRIADEFNRSAEQPPVKLQKHQVAPVNIPVFTFKNFKLSQYNHMTRALLQLLSKDKLQKGIIVVKDLFVRKKAMETNESTTVPKRIRRDDSLDYPRRIRRAANSSDDSKQVDDFWYHYAGDAATSCKVPKKGLKTAEIRCKIWPQSITCNIYCVYGSAFPEGILRTLNCSFQRNRWSDYFEECQPFVNCKVHLIGPGTLKCVDNRVNQSPSCNIGCEEYEDHDATKPRMYECKANGTWAPPLPPCVAKKSGTDLIRAPNVLEHKTIDYPKG